MGMMINSYLSLSPALLISKSSTEESEKKEEKFSFKKFIIKVRKPDRDGMGGKNYVFSVDTEEGGINVLRAVGAPGPGVQSGFNINDKRYHAWLAARFDYVIEKSKEPKAYKTEINERIKELTEKVLPKAKGQEKKYLNEIIEYFEKVSK